jgi:hypothetical protein
MKPIRVLFDEPLLERLDAHEEVKALGRSAVLRRAAAAYLLRPRARGPRARAIAEAYRRAYGVQKGRVRGALVVALLLVSPLTSFAAQAADVPQDAVPAASGEAEVGPAAGSPIVPPIKIAASRLGSPAARGVNDFGARQQMPAKQNWIKRHPVVFGASVGFVAGFVVGAVQDDSALFEGAESLTKWLLGGVGAAGGALVGWIVGNLTK